uniref:Uncharacterized protein n=1 Tax=Anguilla anguilla TaxID=7936 RepID=A0A0E9WF36_ANGAN
MLYCRIPSQMLSKASVRRVSEVLYLILRLRFPVSSTSPSSRTSLDRPLLSSAV